MRIAVIGTGGIGGPYGARVPTLPASPVCSVRGRGPSFPEVR
jgi:ketopantoate reductase